VAGNTSRVADGGLRLPIESHVLHAFARRAEPIIPSVITFAPGISFSHRNKADLFSAGYRRV